MDVRLKTVAESCLNGAYQRTMSFPQIIGVLAENGFDGYLVDYRRDTTTYYLADGDSVTLEGHATQTPVAPAFDASGVAGAIRAAQANGPDYSYKGFSETVKGFGCAGYLVSIIGRRVVYFGRTGETHVECFPQ